MRTFFFPAVAAAFALSFAMPGFAHDGMMHDGCPAGQTFTAGELTITGAFTRETLPDANVGAGYFTIDNAGAEADRLIGAASDVAPTVELHTMTTENGVMKMQHLEDGIEIPAGGSVSLAPGGLHVMFIGLTQLFLEGECVEVTLTFEKAGELPIQLSVGPVGASAPAEHH